MVDLHAKAGPLPVWAWGGLIGVAAVGFVWWRAGNNTASTAGTDTANADGTTADSEDAIDGAFDAGTTSGSSGVTTSTTDTTSDDSDFVTNDTWEAQAVSWASSHGLNPLATQRAIEKYLAGDVLTVNQTNDVNSILQHSGLGTPPEGVAGLPTPTFKAPAPTKAATPVKAKPKPAPTKAAKPKTGSYTVKHGDTLSAIAKKYGTTVTAIAKANGIHDVNKISSGQHLKIPA